MDADEPSALALGTAAALCARAREDLEALAVRGRLLAEAVRWQAPSARVFQRRADALLERLGSAARDAGHAADAARRAQTLIIARGGA